MYNLETQYLYATVDDIFKSIREGRNALEFRKYTMVPRKDDEFTLVKTFLDTCLQAPQEKSR